MKATVDQDTCIGCGLCTGIQPEVFQMNEDGKSHCVSDVSEDQNANVQEAIDSCPTSAIHWD